VDLSNRMQNTGETKQYLALSRGCRPCKEVADQVEGYFEAGGFVRTDGWAVEAIRVSQPGGGGQVTATVDITSSPTEYAISAGAPPQSLAGGSMVELMTLDPRNLSWMLVDLEQQAQ
jgi:hypothetical protein